MVVYQFFCDLDYLGEVSAKIRTNVTLLRISLKGIICYLFFSDPPLKELSGVPLDLIRTVVRPFPRI